MIEAQVLERDQDSSLGHYLKEWLAHARGRVRATTYAGYEYLIRSPKDVCGSSPDRTIRDCPRAASVD
jgi:hypothetical protein